MVWRYCSDLFIIYMKIMQLISKLRIIAKFFLRKYLPRSSWTFTGFMHANYEDKITWCISTKTDLYMWNRLTLSLPVMKLSSFFFCSLLREWMNLHKDNTVGCFLFDIEKKRLYKELRLHTVSAGYKFEC